MERLAAASTLPARQVIGSTAAPDVSLSAIESLRSQSWSFSCGVIAKTYSLMKDCFANAHVNETWCLETDNPPIAIFRSQCRIAVSSRSKPTSRTGVD